MRSKKIVFSNFSRAISSELLCVRPDTEKELIHFIATNKNLNVLARGAGLSYSDCAFNLEGPVVESHRLNHLIRFDKNTGIIECQGGVSFQDLFLVDPDFIPQVIPGTVHASVAGGLAHDVHGKNNHRAGCFGQHIAWFELLLNNQIVRCSPEENTALFHATIAGLGLTGLIMRLGIRLHKASRFVQVDYSKHDDLSSLLNKMTSQGIAQDYQVAWLDLLNNHPRGLLTFGNHCAPIPHKEESVHTVPLLPFGLVKAWNMKLFNRFYYQLERPTQSLNLLQFNNPLDKIRHWNRLYGRKGFIQFQAVFDTNNAAETLHRLIDLIKAQKATPSLAVLKLFTQSGQGLLSFCRPGFTLAIDFIHNDEARKAIGVMNKFMAEENGRVYLAKDLLLTPDEFKTMYPNHLQFSQVLSEYNCSMNSMMARRLGITK